MRLRRQGGDGGAEPARKAPLDRAQLTNRVGRLNRRLRRLQSAVDSQHSILSSLADFEARARPQLDELTAFRASTADVVDGSRRLLAHSTAVPASHTDALRVRDADGRTIMGYADAQVADAASTYAHFEDLMRGSREEIQDKQRVYLPLLVAGAPVLDLGCGRGEFLELVRDAGGDGHGVDLDAAMVAEATARGLDARVRDAFDELADTPDKSIGTVISFQVVEHLDLEQLLRLLSEIARVLRPDGLVVLETVNLHSIQASRFFWLDPTHRLPLFPETLLSLIRGAGFPAAITLFPGSTGDLTEDLRDCGDYSVVAAHRRQTLVSAGLLEG